MNTCKNKRNENVTLVEGVFGELNGNQVKSYTWETPSSISVTVISYGAIITSVKVPDVYGIRSDVVLGFDDVAGYLRSDNPYFGATVGRCANRIANGRFQIDGVTYELAKNIGKNHLHGGIVGFDKVIWNSFTEGNKVIFSHLSPDLDEGYPGNLINTVSYELLEDGSLHVEFLANSDKPTVVNLTNHSYFNLAGHETGSGELLKHVVAINADRITEVNNEAIPTGKFFNVGGTPYDLRTPKVLGDVIGDVQPGYDHNFCITRGEEQEMTFVSRVTHPQSGRYLEVYSDQPGVQFYTANFLPSPDQSAVPGKAGAGYRKHGAFCLETQNFPDAVNHQNFPSAVVRPGQGYRHRVKYTFGNTGDRVPFVSS